MELDSSPVEIDELQRAVTRLEMEESYLAEAATRRPGTGWSGCAPSSPTVGRSWRR